MNYLKQPRYENEAWRRAVASLPCVFCFKEGRSQAAHPNHRNKGMQIKSDDCWCVPICVECHHEFDQGMKWSKYEKRVMMDEWIILTLRDLALKGLVGPLSKTR